MVPISSVVSVPGQPAHYRGVISLRGEVIPLLDIRVFLGMEPLATSMQTLLAARKQDHLNWLRELESSVAENRPFGLTTDPHKCKFGLWYDAYQVDNLSVMSMLRGFDAPHKQIHAVGHTVTQLVQQGDCEAARRLIEQTRQNELSALVGLFDNLITSFQEYIREIAIVSELGGRRIALATDAVLGVERLTPIENGDTVLTGVQAECVSTVAKSASGGEVLMLSPSALAT